MAAERGTEATLEDSVEGSEAVLAWRAAAACVVVRPAPRHCAAQVDAPLSHGAFGGGEGGWRLRYLLPRVQVGPRGGGDGDVAS